jgi:hypothetical protein
MKITYAAFAAAILTFATIPAYAGGSYANTSASFRAFGQHAVGYASTYTDGSYSRYCGCRYSDAGAASSATATTYGHTSSASSDVTGSAIGGRGSTTSMNLGSYSAAGPGFCIFL